MALRQAERRKLRAKGLGHRASYSPTPFPLCSLSPLLYALCLCILFFAVGCGSAWRGRIVHLEDGKLVIQAKNDDKIKSGRKVLIYREKTITHPVTGEVLGDVRDDIAEVSVLRARDRFITAAAAEPYFSMMMMDDQAVAVRGSVKRVPSSAHEVGKIREVDAERKMVEIAVTLGETISPGSVLTAIRYADVVFDPDTGQILAVAVEPVADLQVTRVDADGRLWASYSLVETRHAVSLLGWVESDDVVIKRTGDILSERLWFQEPPDGFSEAWTFARSYLHAIRYYNSGQYREAILELNDVVQMDPEYRDAAYLLGLCYANLNRYEEATTHFKDILARTSDDAKTWAALAYAYLKQGKLQEAAEAYKELARLLPGDPKVWTDIGDIYRMLDDHQEAEQAYKKALEINADDEEAAYELQVGGK